MQGANPEVLLIKLNSTLHTLGVPRLRGIARVCIRSTVSEVQTGVTASAPHFMWRWLECRTHAQLRCWGKVVYLRLSHRIWPLIAGLPAFVHHMAGFLTPRVCSDGPALEELEMKRKQRHQPLVLL